MKDQKGDDTTPFVYKDFSKVSEDSIPALKKKFGSNETSELHFPVRLHYMLNEMEKDGQSKIISWQPHGRCFCIHDTALLEHSALPL